MKRCDQCGETFTPRQANARFCCAVCANAWHGDDRRKSAQIVRTMRDRPTEAFTYHDLARIDDAPGGRYASLEPHISPAQLPSANWSSDPLGPEPFVDGRGESLTLGKALG